jgi:hypothetical protein
MHACGHGCRHLTADCGAMVARRHTGYAGALFGGLGGGMPASEPRDAIEIY